MPIGKFITKFLPKAGSKTVSKGGKAVVGETAEQLAKQTGQETAENIVEGAGKEAVEKSVTKNIGEGFVGGSIKFTTQEVAVPLLRVIAPNAVLAGVGIYISNSIGKYFAETIDETKEAVREALCDSEDDSESCELIVNSAIGLGGVALVGGVIVLGLLVTRR